MCLPTGCLSRGRRSASYPKEKTWITRNGAVTEVVEAQGHLIDSHIMERIFDTVVEFQGKFEVEKFQIGRTNSDPSQLRLKIEAPGHKQMAAMLEALVSLGCSPVDSGDAELRTIEKDKCAPEDFYSTTNHRTYVRVGGSFIEVQDQRMDALVVVRDGQAWCRKLRDIKAGDQVVVGMRGIRVIPESKERDRLAFSFMSNGISSERQVETAVQQTAALIRSARDAGQKVIVVAGPVVVHTGGSAPLAKLIRAGYVQAVLSGNALGRSRHRGGDLRHVARGAAGGWASGRARPSQSHARHQRDQSLRRYQRRRGERPARPAA